MNVNCKAHKFHKTLFQWTTKTTRILSTKNECEENYICLFVLPLISVVYRPNSQISKLIKKYRNFLLFPLLLSLCLYTDSFKSRTKTCCKKNREEWEKFKCNWRNHIVLHSFLCYCLARLFYIYSSSWNTQNTLTNE
jgi:hypothetical protein